MAIDAKVKKVHLNADGSGELELVPRGDSAAGQSKLTFNSSPENVKALEGLEIWGGGSFIMLGDTEIAQRLGYVPIVFHSQDTFDIALKGKV